MFDHEYEQSAKDIRQITVESSIAGFQHSGGVISDEMRELLDYYVEGHLELHEIFTIIEQRANKALALVGKMFIPSYDQNVAPVLSTICTTPSDTFE